MDEEAGAEIVELQTRLYELDDENRRLRAALENGLDLGLAPDECKAALAGPKEPEGNGKALPCIVCGAELDSIAGPNQPSGGTAFSTGGHYGSTVFDPMDGTRMEITVCDECLRSAIGRGRTLQPA